ncbi:MAG: PAS-domain containing protein [Pseudomonadota bacterium]
MEDPNITRVLLFAAISLVAAAVALMLVGRVPAFSGRLMPGWAARRKPRPQPVFADMTRRYEFREGYLLSPQDPNDAFLDAGIDRSRAFDALRLTLGDMSDAIPSCLDALADRGEAFLVNGQFGPDAFALSGRLEDDRMIITVAPAAPGTGREAVDSSTLQALRTEVQDLREMLDHGPMVMWKRGPSGRIEWANAPYFALAEQMAENGAPVAWPVPDIFDVAAPGDAAEDRVERVNLNLAEGAGPAAFELSCQARSDGALVCVALPNDPLVAAEASLRSFIQTLSQTFALLPIGMAVFDDQRDLVMFNPALTKLSGLDVPFLSNRPSLVTFLDALRDRQRMPEPKNYRAWRDQIARLEQGAKDGSYQELWTLPGGDTLRVIGRPHPDGAVAFMFEDISSEVSLTRKFRGDLELYHAVFDALPGATAVFGHDGALVLSNAAYDGLWGLDPEGVPTMDTLADSVAIWRDQTEDTDLWDKLRRNLAGNGQRAPLSRTIKFRQGPTLHCEATPLSGGATLVRFVPHVAADTDHGSIEVRLTTGTAIDHVPVSVSSDAADAGVSLPD